jgi:hypothetical protein
MVSRSMVNRLITAASNSPAIAAVALGSAIFCITPMIDHAVKCGGAANNAADRGRC